VSYSNKVVELGMVTSNAHKKTVFDSQSPPIAPIVRKNYEVLFPISIIKNGAILREIWALQYRSFFEKTLVP
jgi:hypothetical protein